MRTRLLDGGLVFVKSALSIGDWGKVLNQTVFACRLPDDLETPGSLMIQMNTLQIAKGQPVMA